MTEAAVSVALVLGASVRPGGAPSAALARRAHHAAHLWQAGEVGALVLSGGIRTHPPSEADVMAALCRGDGVPEAALRRERAAQTTEDNVRLSLPLLRELGAQEVVIVTDRYHAARALLVARRSGLKALKR